MTITQRIKAVLGLLLTCATLDAGAAAPSGYYDSCENLSGENLLKALNTKISSHNDIGYSSLWTLYKTSDVKPNGKIWDMYSTKEWTVGDEQCGSYKLVGDCYNREHSFPKSWFDDASPMVSDAFHIYPTDGKVNGQRSNYPFGECAGGTTLPSNGSVKALGRLGSSTFKGYSGTVFEPDDEYKGDFARSYFYMAACYYEKINNWNSPMLDGSHYPAFSQWAIELLLKWHRQDPVSQKETKRNDAVYARQQNRNPFIDHPDLAEYIWGDKKGQRWTSDTQKLPYFNTPADGAVINMGVTAIGNHPLTQTITVKGTNLKENITVSSSNGSFVPLTSSLSASEANSDNGAKLTLTFTSNLPAKASTTLILRSGDAVANITVTAEAVDGLPVLPATDITTEGFSAHWIYVGEALDGGKYILNVYNADESEKSHHSVDAQAETFEVTGLDPATHYYYTVSNSTLVSAKMGVTTATPMPAVNFYYDGDLNFSAQPGVASEAAELMVEIENIDTDVKIEVSSPFEVSSDKSDWSTIIYLNPDEDRCYLRVNSDKAGTFMTTLKATAGDYVNDEATVQAIVSELTSFVEDFEAEITTSGYTGGEWYGTAATWLFTDVGMYEADKSDARSGVQCARFGKTDNSCIEMLTDKPNGVGTVELYGKQWSSSDGEVTIELLYSTDHGRSWSSAGIAPINSNDYQALTFTVNRQGNVRLKVQQIAGKRCIIDDISASNFTATSSIDPIENYHAWDAYCRNGQLVIECASDTDAAVYGVDGITYLSGAIAAGETTISLPKGLYIVSIGDFARRVLVK